MKQGIALIVVLVAIPACKQRRSAPAGPPAVASCDYTSQTATRNHNCFEIYAPSRVASWQQLCEHMHDRMDRGTFLRGKGCPIDGRHGGVLEPDGTIEWNYAGKASYVLGRPFEDAAPAHGPAQAYHCTSSTSCLEEDSVFDLSSTVEKANCQTMGGTFGAGPCATSNVVGRCAMSGAEMATARLFYAPLTADQARETCARAEGAFVAR